MIVYSLLSHSLDLLSSHLAAMRKFLPPHKTVCVQGPYGALGATSGGNVRLRPEDAEKIGISLLDASGVPVLGLSTPDRVAIIADWLWSGAIAEQEEQFAMIVHGDLIPTRPMTILDLLGDDLIATRLQRINGRVFCPLTWYLADTDAGSVAKPSTLARNESWVHGWDARVATPDDMPGCDYDPALHFESCEPGFLHVDKLSASGGEIHRRKLKTLSRVMSALGVDVPDWGPIGETLDGLRMHLPSSHGIPTRLLPEVAMGCAGCGN